MSRETLEPPFIATSFEEYLARITENGLHKILPVQELSIMQAFYAGAVEGLNISASIAKSSNPKLHAQILKEELEHFSKSNQEMAQALTGLPGPVGEPQ